MCEATRDIERHPETQRQLIAMTVAVRKMTEALKSALSQGGRNGKAEHHA